ncbi:OmpA family protein [Flavobacterium sp. GA093]|uniref:OmpA family protein n=1 Tax=Flavobacterium hydrocarbonoxydans TaxID=2683249 RepID=A0A6I4NGX4_9FLAO|nr:OmpA family protein [Flavobacterium hydrocarbonoxydans]MWB93193.1 OmpA family protein [Flavobacterium hydrocarbonoxydans]
MKKILAFYLIFASLILIKLYAQPSKINSANEKHEKNTTLDIIESYKRIANKGYKSEEILTKLGDSDYFNSKFESAAKWYGELYAMNKNMETAYLYRFGQSLKAIGETEKGNQMLEKFYAKDKKDTRSKIFKENKNYIAQIKKDIGRYKIENLAINTPYSEYGSFKYGNTIYFASARDTGGVKQQKQNLTGKYFTDIYTAALDSDGRPNTEITKLDNNINSKFNESSPVVSKDGKTIYFTRNNYLEGKKGENTKNVTLVKIYSATIENGKATKVTELPFNSDNYSTAHPALSPDGKTLFFASDMPGTLGQSDLFKVSINSDGTYGKPINLGKEINTAGRESFPYITDDNIIYFASNSHPGLGGFDLFSANLNLDGSIGNIQNLGADINSPLDDFACIFDPVTKRGYFSSNKNGGKGSDDIYSFLEIAKLSCNQELSGQITDFQSGLKLTGAKVILYDQNLVVQKTVTTDIDGNYSFSVECGKTYFIRTETTAYNTKETNILISFQAGKSNLPIALEKTNFSVKIGDDLGKCFIKKIIPFDLNEFNITQTAAIDLEKILDILEQNPTMKLDIRSHTDNKQIHKFNQALSDKRADAILSWLIKKGANTNNLTAKGYAETQLINNCTDGIKCSEEEHQLNNRIEFIIKAL